MGVDKRNISFAPSSIRKITGTCSEYWGQRKGIANNTKGTTRTPKKDNPTTKSRDFLR